MAFAILMPIVGIAQGPKAFVFSDWSILGRQIESNVNGQTQQFRLFGFTLEGGMNSIEGLPQGLSFGVGIDTDQEVVKEIVAYDGYGQPVTAADFLERKSDYLFMVGMEAGPVRVMGTVGAQTRGHTRFFVNWDDGTTEELSSAYQFNGVPAEYIYWTNELTSSLVAGINLSVISQKVFARANATYNLGIAERDRILGSALFTFRPNDWFGFGLSGEQAYLQGAELGAHLSFGIGDDTWGKGMAVLRFGPTYAPARGQGIGFAGSLVISFDGRHSGDSSNGKSTRGGNGFRSM